MKNALKRIKFFSILFTFGANQKLANKIFLQNYFKHWM